MLWKGNDKVGQTKQVKKATVTLVTTKSKGANYWDHKAGGGRKVKDGRYVGNSSNISDPGGPNYDIMINEPERVMQSKKNIYCTNITYMYLKWR